MNWEDFGPQCIKRYCTTFPFLTIVLRLPLFLVYCQSVKAVPGNIEGELAGTAVFKWEIERARKEILFAQLTLNRGATLNLATVLFRGFENPPQPAVGQNVDRLNATIFGTSNVDLKITYQLTLKDLQFSDKNSVFFLRALFQFSNGSVITGSFGAAVTLITVYGSCFFFLFIFEFHLLFFNLTKHFSYYHISCVYLI